MKGFGKIIIKLKNAGFMRRVVVGANIHLFSSLFVVVHVLVFALVGFLVSCMTKIPLFKDT